MSSEIVNGGRVQLVVSTLPLPFSPLQRHRMTLNLDLNLFWGAVACMWGYAVFTFTSHVMFRAVALPPLSDPRPGEEVSLRFSSTVTLSIGSTGCNFSRLLAEISVSLWSSSPAPENETDACEVFEVRNCRSPCAIIEQLELWSLARIAALVLLLRYVQTPEPLLVECFSKCWSACVRHVLLGLTCVCFCVWCVQADPGYTEHLHHANGLWAKSSLAAQHWKKNSYPRRNSLGLASESCELQSRFSAQNQKLNWFF